MDKYIRNDDENDDNDVYRGESYPEMTLSKSKHQELKVHGEREEIEVNYGAKYSMLSPQEKRLLGFIMGGKSIRAASKSMNIRQQTAQEYWGNIKEKMK